MKKIIPLLLLLNMPLLALANMNGGMHINTGKLLLFLVGIPLVFIVNLVLAIRNIKRKNKVVTIINGILTLPIVAGTVYSFKYGGTVPFYLLLFAVLHLYLIKKSIPS